MRCARCEGVVPPGHDRTVTVHQGTGATPDLVIHANPTDCQPIPRVNNHPIRRQP